MTASRRVLWTRWAALAWAIAFCWPAARRCGAAELVAQIAFERDGGRLGLSARSPYRLEDRSAAVRGWPGAPPGIARLGLPIHAVAHVWGMSSTRRPPIVGAFELAVGFGLDTLAHLNPTDRFALRWGRDQPLSLAVGWLRKPAGLPRSQARFGGPWDRGRYTAGLGLHFSPRRTRSLDLDLFVDPFAAKADSFGGFQISLGF